jgi:hypothetical protein
LRLVFGGRRFELLISTGVEIGLDKELTESFIPVRRAGSESTLVHRDAGNGVQKIGFLRGISEDGLSVDAHALLLLVLNATVLNATVVFDERSEGK